MKKQILNLMKSYCKRHNNQMIKIQMFDDSSGGLYKSLPSGADEEIFDFGNEKELITKLKQ